MANQKFKIRGNKKISGYDSELEIDVDEKYEAYSKTIPSQPTPLPGGGQVVWFNNFGVRTKSNKKRANVPYTVVLQAPPPGKKLFYDDNGPQEIRGSDAGNGKVRFSLSLGDPPVGMGP